MVTHLKPRVEKIDKKWVTPHSLWLQPLQLTYVGSGLSAAHCGSTELWDFVFSSYISWVIVKEMRQSILQVNKSLFYFYFFLLQCTNWLFVLYCMVCMYKYSKIWHAIMSSLLIKIRNYTLGPINEARLKYCNALEWIFQCRDQQ